MPALTPLVLDDPRRVGLLAAEIVVNRLAARPRARELHGAAPAAVSKLPRIDLAASYG